MKKIAIGIALGLVLVAGWFALRSNSPDQADDFTVQDAAKAVLGWCIQASPFQFTAIDADMQTRDKWIENLNGGAPYSQSIEDRRRQVASRLGELQARYPDDSGFASILWEVRVGLEDAQSVVNAARDNPQDIGLYLGRTAEVEFICGQMLGALNGMVLDRKY